MKPRSGETILSTGAPVDKDCGSKIRIESNNPLLVRRGGCANKKCREATEAAQTGW